MTIKSIVLIIAFTAFTGAGNWKADTAGAKVSFSVKGPFGTVNGKFTGLLAELQFDEKNPAGGSITASIDAKSVSTGIGLRNKHLRDKEESFNTDKYPRISFRSSRIEKTGARFKAIGTLTIKGISKPVDIPFSFTSHDNKGTFTGKFVVKREDYNVGKPGGSTGSEVTITLEVPAKK